MIHRLLAMPIGCLGWIAVSIFIVVVGIINGPKTFVASFVLIGILYVVRLRYRLKAERRKQLEAAQHESEKWM